MAPGHTTKREQSDDGSDDGSDDADGAAFDARAQPAMRRTCLELLSAAA
jgi:hypothetical protein